MSEPKQPRPRRGVQFAISTLVLGVWAAGALLGFQIKTNWSLGESLCGVLMILMGALLIADTVNWGIRKFRAAKKRD